MILAVAFTALRRRRLGPARNAARRRRRAARLRRLLCSGAGSARGAVVAARDGASAGALGGLAFALIGKMTALFVLVFLALRVAHLAVMPFGLGFSVLVISILLVGLTGRAVEAEAQTR